MQELMINETNIKDKIHNIRNQQVMLDRDLAELYGVENRALKQAVKRNIERFPADFMFELTDIEIDFMVSQSVIPSKSISEEQNLSLLQNKGLLVYQVF